MHPLGAVLFVARDDPPRAPARHHPQAPARRPHVGPRHDDRYLPGRFHLRPWELVERRRRRLGRGHARFETKDASARTPESAPDVRQLRRRTLQPARARGGHRCGGRRRPTLQPAVHLRRDRAGQDPPHARDRASRVRGSPQRAHHRHRRRRGELRPRAARRPDPPQADAGAGEPRPRPHLLHRPRALRHLPEGHPGLRRPRLPHLPLRAVVVDAGGDERGVPGGRLVHAAGDRGDRGRRQRPAGRFLRSPGDRRPCRRGARPQGPHGSDPQEGAPDHRGATASKGKELR